MTMFYLPRIIDIAYIYSIQHSPVAFSYACNRFQWSEAYDVITASLGHSVTVSRPPLYLEKLWMDSHQTWQDYQS